MTVSAQTRTIEARIFVDSDKNGKMCLRVYVSFTLYVCVCVHLSSYVTDYVYMWKAVFDLNGQPTK